MGVYKTWPCKDFRFVIKYLKAHLPEWAQPAFLSAMRKAIKYRGFPEDYRREMQGIADALQLDVGLIVMGDQRKVTCMI